MYLIFWNQKQLSRLAVALLLVLMAGVGFYGYFTSGKAVTVLKSEPIYRGQSKIKAVALTFNVDWGEEYLPAMLETMSQSRVKGTFFLTGRWAERHPELTRAIHQAGHEIGNHGYSHPHANNLSKEANQREILRTEEAIASLTRQRTRLFAPPYGENKRHVVAAAGELGYRTIMWTIDTLDWDTQRTSPADIQRRVKQKLQNGAIILMHPTAATSQALPQVIADLRQEGYQFLTVSEIVAGIQ